ncbi:ropporin-1-like protein isoform X1 [Vidua macroura]|uniref:ropporin-1-like protein isoform X1 n=2 Tax=Vidua macroura TaxID=187451 RepID=UPI0023A81034|nr:ropporin-1-like protein isoform X1 [Vidua macroura]XP_053856116.1 ropporin-1-like protein isoform X1 [Vidua macroura]XP_053856125.1 ropporin-1-like protein isoform X1 [Vidua macroura]XP_053856134.1 ropporin-1-like protein isoform X1 [Vidua macroura]XP_053856142.1 ropporin-1-like protein isoform X1 [Vidua macroura]XP_053856148.1 ropporin-1-like protein isoform X1 [Vidua macroura]
MPLPETMFCAQQIKIPPELPDILKQFTKAAIRTQPFDVLQWAAAYFSALSKGEPLPVKERLEMPLATVKKNAGLTPGLLKVLHKQLSSKGMVTIAELREKWKHLGLPEEQLEAILQLDSFGEKVEWMKFLALGCSVLGGSLLSSMKQACEILTRDAEGGAARIPFETFSFLYSYLASIDGEISQTETKAFLHGIKEQADKHSGMVLIRHFLPHTFIFY